MTGMLTVTLCGSLSRAAYDLARVHRALALAGHLVHAPVPPLPGEPDPTPVQFANLTARHLAAIERSDLVIAVVPDGRMGDATASELAHADRCGVPVRVVSDVDGYLAELVGALV